MTTKVSSAQPQSISQWTTPSYNMDITKSVLNARSSDNCLIKTAAKVAVYSAVPLMLIAALEAVLKNAVLVTLGKAASFAANRVCYREKAAPAPVSLTKWEKVQEKVNNLTTAFLNAKYVRYALDSKAASNIAAHAKTAKNYLADCFASMHA